MLIYPNDDVPVWARQILQNVEEFLGLKEWEIRVTMDDSPGNDRNNSGVAYLNGTYRRGLIVLHREEFEDPTPEVRQTLIHEMLHVALSLYDQAISTMIDLYVPESDQKKAWRIIQEGEEPTVVTLSRSIQRYILL